MKVKFKKHMEQLYNLAGEIGELAESDYRYVEVYSYIASAIDIAESNNLIVYKEEE